MEDYYKPENLKATKYIISPSKKYQLTIETYSTKPKCWDYTRGTVVRLSDNHKIITIDRNYSIFHHSFFIKNNCEWLFCGKTYMSQTFVNLDTGDVYDNTDRLKLTDDYKKGICFCWTKVYSSNDGNTLAVHGCIWGGPYFLGFYDFSDPSDLKLLKFEDPIDYASFEPYWTKDDIFVCFNTEDHAEINGQYVNVDDFILDIQKNETVDDRINLLPNDDSKWLEIPTAVTFFKRFGDIMVKICHLEKFQENIED